MDMSLDKLWETVKGGEACCAAVRGQRVEHNLPTIQQQVAMEMVPSHVLRTRPPLPVGFRGISRTQGMNLDLPHCRWILYCLSHQRRPYSCSVQLAQSFSHVQFFVTPWTVACQASLSITNSWSLLKLMSIESVMPSKRLILCHSLFLLPSVFPSIRVFSNELALCIR